MKKNKTKYKASFAKVNKAIKNKASTFNFEGRGFKSLKAYGEACLGHSSIPANVKGGHRLYDNVVEIYDWLRFDCDEEGEKATICSILTSRGLAFVATPSTNYDKKLKSYKWHIQVVTSNTAQDVEQYKKQCKIALVDLGIALHDRRVTEVCVQNMNPYKNGDAVERGLKLMEVNEGDAYKLSKPDKKVKYNPMSKTVYNGKGSSEVINVSIASVKGSLTELNSSSGINVAGVGWTTIGKLNLEAGSMVGGLSCPAHNTRHDNGKGAYKTGYAIASMNEGGDVWITCTGAECQGHYYKMKQDSYGAYTKLTDLFELRKLVSLSAFDFKSSTVSYINAKDTITNFRDKDIITHWGKELFWKVNTEPSEELQIKIDKLIRRGIKDMAKSFTGSDVSEGELKERMITNIGADEADRLLAIHGTYQRAGYALSVEAMNKDKIDMLISEHAWLVIKDSMDNKYQYAQFRAKYENHPNSFMGYVDDVVDNVISHIKTHRQYTEIEYAVKPYQTSTTGSVTGGVFNITFNKVTGSFMHGKVNEAIVKDYKKHNPYLDDMIDMIMAQRFGADKKRSYLWIKASSNWGKSFLFDGVFGEMSYEVSSDEVKKAIKGEPSGLDINAITKSSCLFIDEFKGAVAELKNISHKITVSPKNRGKFTVPLNMKIFASAEQVTSLVTSSGAMEAQFANRFLYIEAKGDLMERKIYKNDKRAYFDAVKLYVNHKVHKISEEYGFYGELAGSSRADKLYTKLADKYTIKRIATDLSESLPPRFKAWLLSIRDRDGQSESLRHQPLLDGMVVFHKRGHTALLCNVPKLADIFIREAVAKNEVGMVAHKMPHEIMGFDRKRDSLAVSGRRFRGYMLKL